jgi:hypothetical protein
MANRHKVQKRNVGGAANAGGNPKVFAAAKDKTGGFKSGGTVPGVAGRGRLDKRARGGRTGSPFSSARTSEKGNKTSSGGTSTRP